MNKLHDLMDSALPVLVPSGVEYERFLATLLRLTETTNPTLALLRRAFSAKDVLQFISTFNGMTLELPNRAYWVTVFRDTHIFMTLTETPKKVDSAKWRSAVLDLSKAYKMTPKAVVNISNKLKSRFKRMA